MAGFVDKHAGSFRNGAVGPTDWAIPTPFRSVDMRSEHNSTKSLLPLFRRPPSTAPDKPKACLLFLLAVLNEHKVERFARARSRAREARALRNPGLFFPV